MGLRVQGLGFRAEAWRWVQGIGLRACSLTQRSLNLIRIQGVEGLGETLNPKPQTLNRIKPGQSAAATRRMADFAHPGADKTS